MTKRSQKVFLSVLERFATLLFKNHKKQFFQKISRILMANQRREAKIWDLQRILRFYSQVTVDNRVQFWQEILWTLLDAFFELSRRCSCDLVLKILKNIFQSWRNLHLKIEKSLVFHDFSVFAKSNFAGLSDFVAELLICRIRPHKPVQNGL